MTTFEHEYRTIATKPRPKKYASLASDGGKPCPHLLRAPSRP